MSNSEPKRASKKTGKSTGTTAGKTTKGRKGFDVSVREKVIQAAEIVIEENGLDGLKARAIARRAAISVGSVYNLFHAGQSSFSR